MKRSRSARIEMPLVVLLAIGVGPSVRRDFAQAETELPTAAESPSPRDTTLWATGDTLMPAWGFYPLSQEYGGTKPSGRWAAWSATGKGGTLTWVAEFPATGDYHGWVRLYGGYGDVTVSIDERPIAGGRSGSGGAHYVWKHLGEIAIDKGRHHVDLAVSSGMFDAVLFTTNADLRPDQVELPRPIEKPLLRALRTYRGDGPPNAQAPVSGLVIGHVLPYAETLDDWAPRDADRVDSLRPWGSADQYVNDTFVVRALKGAPECHVSLTHLTGPEGTRIDAKEIDLRVVHVRERRNQLFGSARARMLMPELLLRDDRTTLPPKGKQGGYGGGACVTGIPAHESRRLWLTIHVAPKSPPGAYRGEVLLEVVGQADRTLRLPVQLEVLPVDLKPAEGYYGIYYPSQPIDPKRPKHVTPERYAAELQDQVRHGLNTATLYGGFSTLAMARDAGMTKAPCLMHWPDGSAPTQIAKARSLGFDDLYYYGVDEPTLPEQIERCRKEAERRRKLGIHMMTALNSVPAREATKDFVDRPVYNLYVFGGKDNSAAMYARQKGFRPVSYWTTATAYPLWYRGLTGLYNKACGYLGSVPWAYQDFPDDRLYDPDRTVHRVSYPDEFGSPIPTLAWEAHRAGIDDVRYLEALDRGIAAAEARRKRPNVPPPLAEALSHAREVRKRRFESIDGRWFQYLCSLRPGDLSRSRREMADAIVALDASRAD